jgi:hypothetical protein
MNYNKADPLNMRRKEEGKIKVIVIIILLITFIIMVCAGYIGFKMWWAKNQPRSALGGIKINADVLHWSYRNTPELYSQIIALDDVIILIETEIKRLKALAQKYPAQKDIIFKESQELNDRKEELIGVLSKAGLALEAIYVIHKIDVRKGQSKINSKETYELSKELTSTLRKSSRLALRIKSQNPETWIDGFKKIF